jgi:hypothetical protein
VNTLHLILAWAIVGAFALLMLWGLALRIAGRSEEPVAFRAVLHWTENILVVQIVVGIVLLLLGRRITGVSVPVLHYFYGSLFPLIAIVGGRIAKLRREEAGKPGYVGIAWGALFAFGLTLRALMVGLESVG